MGDTVNEVDQRLKIERRRAQMENMRNIVATVILVFFVMPALLPFASHDTLHVIHNSYASHHRDNPINEEHAHSHDHDVSDHATNRAGISVHHPISLDVVSYYEDLLHVELQQARNLPFTPPSLLRDTVGYDHMAVLSTAKPHRLTAIQARAPPDTHIYIQDYSTLYLTTLRLRI